MEDITKNIIFTNALGANVQPTAIQYQTADGTILKQPKIEGQKDQPTFYYTTTNVSGILFMNSLKRHINFNKSLAG